LENDNFQGVSDDEEVMLLESAGHEVSVDLGASSGEKQMTLIKQTQTNHQLAQTPIRTMQTPAKPARKF
jgi:hypothetical protein